MEDAKEAGIKDLPLRVCIKDAPDLSLRGKNKVVLGAFARTGFG